MRIFVATHNDFLKVSDEMHVHWDAYRIGDGRLGKAMEELRWGFSGVKGETRKKHAAITAGDAKL